MLVLSRFAGAAQQLRAALLVNPSHVDKSAAALADALGMSVAEQSIRMRLLRANVATFDACRWAHQLVDDAMVDADRRHSTAAQRFGAEAISA